MSSVNFLEKLLAGVTVEWKALWEVTVWDKKFNAVARNKQPKTINYTYFLAVDLFKLEKEGGNVFLLSTGEKTGWTTEELAGANLREGEVVAIPWGKSRPLSEVLKYYKGKFVTADNRIATSSNTKILLNKYLYYWLLHQSNNIDSFYRGAGIQHPSMAALLDMEIPIPPLGIQEEIVRILDAMTTHTAELTAELTARKKQYNYYRDKLLRFEDGEVEWKTLGEVTYINTGSKPEEILDEPTDFDYINAGTARSGYSKESNCEGDTVTTPSRGQGGIGFVGYQNKPFWLGPLCYKIRSSDENILINKYIYYYLQSNSKLIIELKKEGGVPAVNKSDLAKVNFPIPSINKQKYIVSTLDKFDALTASITEGLPREIELREKQYAYYRDLLLSFPQAQAA